MSAIGRPDLIDDPRFADVPSRSAHFAEILEILSDWAATLPDTASDRVGDGRSSAWPPARCDRCARCATPIGPRTRRGRRGQRSRRRDDPHAQHAVALRDGDVGLRGEPRYRGEDNRAVLGELLGLDDAELDRLEADGVLSSQVAAPMTLRYPGRADEGDARHPAAPTTRTGPTRSSGTATARSRSSTAAASGCRAATCSTSPPSIPSWASSPGRSTPASAISTASSSCSTPTGRPSFELMQRHATQAAFHVFDVLSIDGHDTIALPYEQRRELVGELVEPGSNWMVPAHRIGDGAALVAATVERGLEGVMAKRLGSDLPCPASARRTGARSRTGTRVEVVIGGYTPGTGNRDAHVRRAAGRRYRRRRLAVRRRRRHRVQPADAGGADGPAEALRTDDVPVRSPAADASTRATPPGCAPSCGPPSRSPSSPTRATCATPASSG